MIPPPDTPDLGDDLRHAHKQLGTLANLLRPHTTSDLTDPVTRAHYYLLRARAVLHEALDQEGAR